MTNAVMVRPGELVMDAGGVPERVSEEDSVEGEAERWGGGGGVWIWCGGPVEVDGVVCGCRRR